MKTRKRILKRVALALLIVALVGAAALVGANAAVIGSSRAYILSSEQAAQLTDVDCILVLGCLVREDGVPSDMLGDRLKTSVELFQLGAAPKLLMSGDHGRIDYDEVDAMKQFAVDAGITSVDVFMDHAGFSTYESMYRAKAIFGVKKVIIVTQQYHLYRAVFAARRLGLDAYGVACDTGRYYGQTMRDAREALARAKDVLTAVFKPEPTYLGETIPIFGNGDLTNDENSNFSDREGLS